MCPFGEAMRKRFNFVADVVNEFIDDKSFRARFEKEISDKRMARVLFAIRARAGKTETEMAAALGCGKETIQALENGGNDGIKVSDLAAYAEACDLNVTIGFNEEKNAARSGAS